ncbi:MAG: valine--tRNA ligase [Proteobacteria bacterium]|nr:valine--tRNA ligase [Pseudomonadota bacterium]
MLNKTYNPKEFEEQIYKEEEVFFDHVRDDKPSFSIIMPPPNVTGSLHLGHALTYTLQDILIRFKRMNGFDAYWQAGTDHAGIATQMVVERELKSEGKTRQEIGRDVFLERAWKWRDYSGNMIVDQQRRLCICPNWKKTKFTLDSDVSNVVRKVFVSLFKDGLIYKDQHLVNWDTHFETAISDLEVNNKAEQGKFYYIRYLVVDSNEEVVVATTRPETLFGDQAVAVHPDDERYQHLIGKFVHLPLTDKKIPIIEDDYCEKELGTGAVKITPAHDFNDFAVGKRHKLLNFNILNKNGTLNENVPLKYQGLTVKEARVKVVDDLKDLLLNIEEKQIMVPYGDRSNTVIEPYLTDQWFLNTNEMAKNALDAVRSDETVFVPKQWENTYFDWLENIQPWCISRQLWWGHQIPVWYGPDGHIFSAESEDEAQKEAFEVYGKGVTLTQDTDVLDTWFSSALWPFSTLGWDTNAPLYQKHYPTSVLITGFDIIFFWVARMMMMGLHFTKIVPFKQVYIHALVRDEKGQKMSKSKGNVIDPLEMIDQFGADALRFTLCYLSTPGRDIKLGASKVETNRNFITKIYNSARFLEMNKCVDAPILDPQSVQLELSRYMMDELSSIIQTTHKNLESLRFDLYASDLYNWFWRVYCDQFLESLKPVLASDIDETLKDEAKATAKYCFVEVLKLLHPVIPMVTEHLFKTFSKSNDLLFNTKWPILQTAYENDHKCIQKVFAFASYIRSLKGLLGLNPSTRFKVYIKGDDSLKTFKNIIIALARLEDIIFCDSSLQRQATFMPFVDGGIESFLELHSQEDAKQAKVILNEKAQILSKEITRLKGKLANEAFKIAKPELYEEDKILFDNKSADLMMIENILSVLV